MKIDLSDKRVLVLGGSGVLGRNLTAELHQRGASVMIAGHNADRVSAQAAQLGAAETAVFDLATPADAGAVVQAALERLGGLDGVINAAGVVAFGPLEDLDDAALDQLVAVDLVGPLRVMRAAIPHLEGGFFVNLTGVVAEQPVASMAAYSAVKAGLSAATRALGRELRRQGVHVLDARPGHTETGLATRPIEGRAPAMPEGMAPAHVAQVVIQGLEAGKRELSAADFAE